MSHLCLEENTAVKTTISNAAITSTMMRNEPDGVLVSELSSFRASLCQPEIKLAKIAVTIKTANGNPMANCLVKRFRRRRLASQYWINPFSSSVSMVNTKVKYRVHPIATAIQIIYIVLL